MSITERELHQQPEKGIRFQIKNDKSRRYFSLRDQVGYAVETHSLMCYLDGPQGRIGTEFFSVETEYFPGRPVTNIIVKAVTKDSNGDSAFYIYKYGEQGQQVKKREGCLPAKYKQLAILAGFFTETELPQQIDFQATVDLFRQQVEIKDAQAFPRPILVPQQG